MQKLVYPERSKYFHKDIEKIKKIIIKTYERHMLLRKDQSKERNETRWMHKCESLCKRKYSENNKHTNVRLCVKENC